MKTFADLVKTVGPNGAVMAIYVASQTIRSDDGWMEKSIREMENETGLGRYEQWSAIASLAKLGCLEVEASNGSKRRMKFVGETGFMNDIVALCGAVNGINGNHAEIQHGNPCDNTNHAGKQHGLSTDHAENQHGLSTDRAGNQQGLSTGHADHAGKQQGGADYHAENQHGCPSNHAENQHGFASSKSPAGRGGKGGMGNDSSSIHGTLPPLLPKPQSVGRRGGEGIGKDRGCGGKEGKGKELATDFCDGDIKAPKDLFCDAAKTDVQDDPQWRRLTPPRTHYFATAKKPADVEQAVWDDFIALRRAKKAPLTETALRMLENEAKKAGITTQEAMRMCCANGWQGFKASWMREQKMREAALQERSDRAKGGNGKDEDWWSRVL